MWELTIVVKFTFLVYFFLSYLTAIIWIDCVSISERVDEEEEREQGDDIIWRWCDNRRKEEEILVILVS